MMNKLNFNTIIWILVLTTLFTRIIAGNNLKLDTVEEYNNTMISLHEKISQDYDIPIIQIIAPKNITYAAAVWYCGLDSFRLEFTINEQTDWIGYSLDGDVNVTIYGNISVDTMVGSHSIIVYSNDTSGNMGGSGTVYFTIKNYPPSSTTEGTTFSIPSYISFFDVLLMIVLSAFLIGSIREKIWNHKRR